MKMIKILYLTFFLATSISTIAKPCKEIIGYYPGWQWYDRGGLVNPESIEYSKYTIINYAFFAPDSNGIIKGTDSFVDDKILRGVKVGNTRNSETSLPFLAHTNGVKVLISLGGWTLSSNFPSIAADSLKRLTFVRECVRLVQEYDLDGIDIDWEYPGYVQHNGSSVDKDNFTKMMRMIRVSFDELSKGNNRKLMLTAAFGASPDRMKDIDWEEVVPLMDLINLMTYDFEGEWSAISGHYSPLYGDNSLESTLTYITSTYNIPLNKLCLGFGFYGRSVKTVEFPELNVPTTTQPDSEIFKEDNGLGMYYAIEEVKDLFEERWDDKAKVPYLIGKGSLKTFVSYDNEKSIEEKAKFVVEKNVKGVIVWEITGDYFEDPYTGRITTPLIDVVNNVFCN